MQLGQALILKSSDESIDDDEALECYDQGVDLLRKVLENNPGACVYMYRCYSLISSNDVQWC